MAGPLAVLRSGDHGARLDLDHPFGPAPAPMARRVASRREGSTQVLLALLQTEKNLKNACKTEAAPFDPHQLTDGDPMKRTLRSSALPTAALLALGGVVLFGSPAGAAPATPIHPAVDSPLIKKVHYYGYCRRWYRECRYRWGAGWRFRRCMRIHRC